MIHKDGLGYRYPKSNCTKPIYNNFFGNLKKFDFKTPCILSFNKDSKHVRKNNILLITIIRTTFVHI